MPVAGPNPSRFKLPKFLQQPRNHVRSVLMKGVHGDKQILRLTTPELKNVRGPVRSE
jgi:hypothetical protein